MEGKIKVGILFGGRSVEHEVSLQSAKNVIDAIDREKYEVTLIGIDKRGHWFLYDSSNFLLNADNPKLIKLNNSDKEVVMTTGESSGLYSLSENKFLDKLHVIFPVLHGTFGEDGTLQGLLKLADIPFVGAGVLGSVVGMDKDVMKRLLRDAGIPISDFLSYRKFEYNEINFEEVKNKLGLPMFVKPANLGSSVGISKVHSEDEFKKAIDEAFLYDTKIVIEENIIGRELECAVLGNEKPVASIVGEVVPKHDFYSYDAKYLDENGATLKVPADIPEDVSEKISDLAVKTFTTLSCEGMGRVDLFLKENGDIFVNEINTLPGFTKISMYPRLWSETGISYKDLIDILITLAMDRFNREIDLETHKI